MCQIRPSDLALAEGELAYVRPSFSGSVVQTTPLKRKPITSVETHVSSVGFVRGAWCWGVVESQSSEGLLIGMGAGVRGRLPVLEADRGSSGSSQDQLAVLNDVAQGRRYTPGLPVLCVVLRSDQPNKILYLSGYRAPLAIAASAKAIADTKASGRDALTAAASVLKAGDAFPVGSVVFGQVESPTDTLSTALSLRVRLAPSVLAHVCATHSADRAQWKNSPFSTRFNGEVVYGVVLPLLPPSARSQPVSSAVDEEESDGDVESASEEEALDASASPAAGAGRPTKASKSSKGKSRVSLSLRPSLISLVEKIGPADRCEALVQEEARERSSLRVTGTLVSGFVECANAKGCFILVGRGLMARCLLKELSDGFVKDPAASFPTGKLVAGRVLACEAAGSISLSLKGSVVTGKRSLLAVDAKPQSVVDAAESSSDSEDDDDTEAVPVGVAAKRPAAFAASDDESEGEVSGEESDASDESLPERTAVPSSRALKKSKFDWDGEAEPSSAGSDGGGDEWDIPAETDENEQTTGRRARASAKKRLEGEVGMLRSLFHLLCDCAV